MSFVGGCLCGAIRYRAEAPVIDSGYCHCRTCRRASGAPVVAWFSLRAEQLTILTGSPRRFHSSANGMRDFCANCGAQLFFRGEQEGLVDVTTASLDDPDQIAPDYHIWRAGKISWLETTDTLPRHEDGGPDWAP